MLVSERCLLMEGDKVRFTFRHKTAIQGTDKQFHALSLSLTPVPAVSVVS